jgi:mycofactocin system creatininase family protein
MTSRPSELGGYTWTTLALRPIVLVPVGATEQHGPHLPLDTDTRIASAVANGAAARLANPGVVVAPPIPIGASGEHAGFPGVLSVGTGVLTQVLVELVRSMADWAGRIVFINGHGGNVVALKSAVAQMVNEGHDVAWLPCWHPDADAHAGRFETSLMLHLDPSNVRTRSVYPGNVTPLDELLPALVRDGVKIHAPDGVLGDPTGANAREGKAALKAMISDVERRIRLQQSVQR